MILNTLSDVRVMSSTSSWRRGRLHESALAALGRTSRGGARSRGGSGRRGARGRARPADSIPAKTKDLLDCIVCSVAEAQDVSPQARVASEGAAARPCSRWRRAHELGLALDAVVEGTKPPDTSFAVEAKAE